MARKRILFVDDRPEHLHQPVLRLRMEGYEVDEARSGEAGLEALRSGSYDLLILDAELPGADGWDVLRRVRDAPELAGIKVLVFMAASGETGKLAMIPVDAELRRPFRMEDLVAAVRRVLGESTSRT